VSTPSTPVAPDKCPQDAAGQHRKPAGKCREQASQEVCSSAGQMVSLTPLDVRGTLLLPESVEDFATGGEIQRGVQRVEGSEYVDWSSYVSGIQTHPKPG